MTVVLNQVGPAAERLARDFPGVTVIDIARDDPPAGTRADVFFGGFRQWDRLLPVFAATGVRWVQLSGTGVDGVPEALLRSDITVTCARGASSVPISEYVLAVMLAFEKQLPGNWLHEPPRHWNFQTMDTLVGKTLGLVGLGGIGRRVAHLARAFEMEVVALRRTAAPSGIEGVEVVTDLGEVLRRADHLVLAAPATARTQHLLDADAFAAMKPGAHLVNIARGALVDQDALRAALDAGTVARASLDTVDPEPLPEGHWMYGHPGVFLTPHSSWSSAGFLDTSIDIFCDNLGRFLAGEPLLHVVDADEGY